MTREDVTEIQHVAVQWSIMFSTLLQKYLNVICLLETRVSDFYPIFRHTNGILWFRIHILLLHTDTQSFKIFLKFPMHKFGINTGTSLFRFFPHLSEYNVLPKTTGTQISKGQFGKKWTSNISCTEFGRKCQEISYFNNAWSNRWWDKLPKHS